MEFIIIFLILIIIILLTYLFLLNKELERIPTEIKKIRFSKSNKRIHSNYTLKNLDLLILQINQLIDETSKREIEYNHKNQSLMKMMTNISHDLRTPLTSALGYIDLLLKSDLPKEEKEKERKIKEKKRKLKFRNIFLTLLISALVALLCYLFMQVPIGSILVKGNEFFSDQSIIDLAGIREYPSTLRTPTITIQKKLEENDFIKTAKVEKRKFLTQVVIHVEENKPLFFYQPENKVVLQDGTKVEGDFQIPIVLNQIPEDVYNRFLEKMKQVPNDVLRKISEIRYYPSDVDSELFLLAMNDGIYVYATLPRFERVYHYLEYVEGFNNKKGILHLDSGDYLEILEDK